MEESYPMLEFPADVNDAFQWFRHSNRQHTKTQQLLYRVLKGLNQLMSIDSGIADALTAQAATIAEFASAVTADINDLEGKVSAGQDVTGIVAGIKANTQKISDAATATGNLIHSAASAPPTPSPVTTPPAATTPPVGGTPNPGEPVPPVSTTINPIPAPVGTVTPTPVSSTNTP